MDLYESLEDTVKHTAKGIKDANLIASDSPGILINKKYPLFEHISEEAGVWFKMVSRDNSESLQHFRIPYLNGAALGFVANIIGRLYLSSQFENTAARVAAFFAPEIVSTTAGIAKTLYNRHQLIKELNF